MSMFVKNSQPNAICHLNVLLHTRYANVYEWGCLCVSVPVRCAEKAYYKRSNGHGHWPTTNACLGSMFNWPNTILHFQAMSFLNGKTTWHSTMTTSNLHRIRHNTQGGSKCITSDSAQNLETVFFSLFLYFIRRIIEENKTLVIKSMYNILADKWSDTVCHTHSLVRRTMDRNLHARSSNLCMHLFLNFGEADMNTYFPVRVVYSYRLHNLDVILCKQNPRGAVGWYNVRGLCHWIQIAVMYSKRRFLCDENVR